MAKKQRRKKKKGNKNASSIWKTNFVADAGPGCYIVRKDNAGRILEFESIDPSEFEGQDVPDVAMDPDDKTLSVCNVDALTKVAYVTVFETRCFGADDGEFSPGSTTTNEGVTTPCITFIVFCPPFTFVHLCYMETEDVCGVRIESDVQEWNRHPNPDDSHPKSIGFPLAGGPFLCTQGENGHLTHFFSGNLHAIDFQCPVGTPLIAVGSGVVAECQTKNTALTGVATSNLYSWNSIMLKLESHGEEDDPLFVEYVHIETSKVKVGDFVKLGDVIGTSGSVGFSPEPHLHLAAYRSSAPEAPTVRVQFLQSQVGSANRKSFVPQAGKWYSAEGPVAEQSRAGGEIE